MPKDSENSLAWNPDLCWQILRECPTYKTAVNEFQGELAASKPFDENAQFVFDYLGDEDDCVNPGDERKLQLQIRSDSLEVPHGLVFVYGHKTGNVDPHRKHFQKFLKRYGDVLRFPIPYRVKNPNALLLQGLWSLRPVSEVNDLHIQVAQRERLAKGSGGPSTLGYMPASKLGAENRLHGLLRLNFEINCHFEDRFVLEQIELLVRKVVNQYRKDHAIAPALKRMQKWNQLEANEYLRAWELYRKRDPSKDIDMGYLLVGRELRCDPTSSAPVPPDEELKQYARTRIDYVRRIAEFLDDRKRIS